MNSVRSALLVAGLILLGAWIVKQGGWIDPGFAAEGRYQGLIMGLIVAWSGNALPKRLAEERRACTTRAGYKKRHRIGLAFVLGGLGYSLAWLAAPIDVAAPLAITWMLLALAVVAWIVKASAKPVV
ncbi:MAG: hypothetical protein AAFN07_16985 [Pseudomonadota bacterium]